MLFAQSMFSGCVSVFTPLLQFSATIFSIKLLLVKQVPVCLAVKERKEERKKEGRKSEINEGSKKGEIKVEKKEWKEIKEDT